MQLWKLSWPVCNSPQGHLATPRPGPGPALAAEQQSERGACLRSMWLLCYAVDLAGAGEIHLYLHGLQPDLP